MRPSRRKMPWGAKRRGGTREGTQGRSVLENSRPKTCDAPLQAQPEPKMLRDARGRRGAHEGKVAFSTPRHIIPGGA